MGKARNGYRFTLNLLAPLIGAMLTVVIVLRRLLFTRGYVIYRDLFPGQLYYPHLWHPQGSFLAMENYKFVTFTGAFLPLRGLGLDIYEKAVYVGAMAIAYVAMYVAVYRLLEHLRYNTLSPWNRRLSSALGALTYVANPAAVSIYCDFSLFVGYAFAPLVLLIFMEMLAGQRRRGPAIMAVAGLWWLSAIKAHWILFGGLLLLPPLLMWSLWHWRRASAHRWRHNLGSLVAIVALYLLLSAYWLLPFLQASSQRFVGSYAPITIESIAFLSKSSLRNTVRLLGTFEAWPYVRYRPPSPLLGLPWIVASWVIPGLALAAVLWFRRHWQIWTLAAFALCGIVLTKGVAPPMEGLYTFLVFSDLTPSGFRWLFRVASKWNVFLSLGYSGLAAFALAELTERVSRRRWHGLWKDRGAFVALVVPGGYLVALLLFAWPSFTGDLDGALVPVPLPDSLTAANEWLIDQEGDVKVSWVPVTNGRELDWNERPSGDLYTSLSAIPSIGVNWNRHPVLYYSYAYDALVSDRIANFEKLLSPLNTRYVAFHDDVKTGHIHTGVEPVAVLIESGEEALTNHLEEQRDMHLAWKDGDISIYEATDVAPPLFVPQRISVATGDLTLLTSLSALESYEPVKDAILFDTSRDEGTFPLQVDRLLLGHDAPDHLAFALLPVERFLSPADATQHLSVHDVWSRLDVYQFDWQFLLRDHGIQHWGFDYGQGMAAYAPERVTTQLTKQTNEALLQLPVHVPEADTYHLWVRQLRHPRGGTLHIEIDDRAHGILSGHHPLTGFSWEDSGAVELAAGEHLIRLRNSGGLSAVNALILVPAREMALLRARSQAMAAQIPNIYLLEAETDFVGQVEAPRESIAFSGGRAVALEAHEMLSTTLDIAVPGEYVVAVRASIPTGDPLPTVTVGTTSPSSVPHRTSADEAWLTAGSIHLNRERVSISLQAASNVVVDSLLLYTKGAAATPDELFQDTSPPAEISYERVDPTRYRVRVRAERPFVLALAETYDPLWVASSPDVQVASVPLYGVINGFPFSRTGSYEIIVEYQAQQWARVGRLVTLIAALGLGAVRLLMRALVSPSSAHRL
jgi:hypothetical protein